jgi:hypothetical protein
MSYESITERSIPPQQMHLLFNKLENAVPSTYFGVLHPSTAPFADRIMTLHEHAKPNWVMTVIASQISWLASFPEEYITVDCNKDTARRYLFFTVVAGLVALTYFLCMNRSIRVRKVEVLDLGPDLPFHITNGGERSCFCLYWSIASGSIHLTRVFCTCC